MPAGLAVGAFNVISGVFGALGLASFSASFIPKPPPAVTQIQVLVGQAGANIDSDNLAGNQPAISLFTVDGRLVGSSGGSGSKTFSAGSNSAVRIKNKKGIGNAQSEYVAVYAVGKNAICISAIALKNPNSDTPFGWLGDVGLNCGMDWHWSQSLIGSTPNTKNYSPNCVWITSSNSQNSIRSQGFSMHVTDFSQITPERSQQYDDDIRLMCDSPPRFSAWSTIIPEISPPFFIPALKYNETDGTDPDPSAVLVPGVDKTDYKYMRVDINGNAIHPVRLSRDASMKSRRSFDGQPNPFNGTLISSAHPGHSARQLCESATSYGPDVVSEIEELFCDMGEKRLWPLCSRESRRSCFDTQTNTLQGIIARGLTSPSKSYTTVKTWR